MSRKRNWSEYNRKLVQRGSITFLLDPKVFKPRREKGRMGRPVEFSNQIMLMLMMTKIHFRLPYRKLEGFMRSIMELQGKKHRLPTYSCIAKRAEQLALPALTAQKPSVVAIDASGVKIFGEGEWKVKIHGQSKRRTWLKIHVGIDVDTGDVVAQTTTGCRMSDGKMLETLLDQVAGDIDKVLADGAYDGRSCREVINNKGATALIPPPKNARVRGADPNRDDAVRIIRGLGGDGPARSLWGKLTGYSKRSLVETLFSRMKGLFGSKLSSKKIDNQRVENYLRCLILK